LIKSFTDLSAFVARHELILVHAADRFANHLAGVVVEAGLDLIADDLLELRG
jgi:hypothetical protein